MINRNYQKWLKEARKEAMEYVVKCMQVGYKNYKPNIFDKIQNLFESYIDYADSEFDVSQKIKLSIDLHERAVEEPSQFILHYGFSSEGWNSYWLDHDRQVKTAKIIKAEIGI